MVMAELVIVPVGLGESLSRSVAAVLREVQDSGISYLLTPMGTILEGTWDEVLAVVDRCFRRAEQLSPRISLSLKVDARAGDASRLASKIAAVQEHLPTPARTILDG
ncbi:MAG: MTH1187 family thiamine-binding protein [Fimbriimonadaceae bacterium]|nr:MTH1187 family thiamine-binding protein [Fimbriimonadaceae bacterium]